MKTIEIEFSDDLVADQDRKTLLVHCQEGLIIRRYLGNKISLGKVAELMKMRVEQAIDWLHGLGIPTARMYPPENECQDDVDMDRVISRITMK